MATNNNSKPSTPATKPASTPVTPVQPAQVLPVVDQPASTPVVTYNVSIVAATGTANTFSFSKAQLDIIDRLLTLRDQCVASAAWVAASKGDPNIKPACRLNRAQLTQQVINYLLACGLAVYRPYCKYQRGVNKGQFWGCATQDLFLTDPSAAQGTQFAGQVTFDKATMYPIKVTA